MLSFRIEYTRKDTRFSKTLKQFINVNTFNFGCVGNVHENVKLNTSRLHSISRQCSIKAIVFEYGFETSAIVFFMVPITLITILYVLIGVELRKSASAGSQIQSHETTSGHLRKELSSNSTQFNETRVCLPTSAGVVGSKCSASGTPEIHVSVHYQQRHNSVSSSQQKQIASRRSVIRMLGKFIVFDLPNIENLNDHVLLKL